jgi:predicted component of type VI protein secretion system
MCKVHILVIPADTTDQRLRFQIQAELIVGRSRERVSFETRIDPTRRIEVT